MSPGRPGQWLPQRELPKTAGAQRESPEAGFPNPRVYNEPARLAVTQGAEAAQRGAGMCGNPQESFKSKSASRQQEPPTGRLLGFVLR